MGGSDYFIACPLCGADVSDIRGRRGGLVGHLPECEEGL